MSIDLICTIGPASASYANLKELMLGGMTIARINMSHGNHESHREVIQFLREASRELGKPIRIMADLQGPKIRLGEFEGDGVILKEGQSYDLLITPVTGNNQRANVDYAGITKDIAVGATVLINDGEVKLEVTEVAPVWVKTTCLIGGKISSNKGVNFPGTTLHIQAITDKDREDLAFLLGEGVDLIACSFIRRSAHLEEIREVCRSLSGTVPLLVAKIETLESVKNFRDIAAHSEGIMIARGDLGVELPFEQVPLIQKTLLKECKASGTYVITATQMLQSMIEHPVPTRAEVTDIFQAVQDGTNAVMLSAESSVGKFPIQSVQVLSRVALFAEGVDREENFTLESLYSRFPFNVNS
ncbi:pyruvate kinase [Cohnella luojiensis]|uniref:Pyruvate kinase n=1 Tax=Cohnella luojiensis TaxID=652876 RepID=A0A4Y8LYB6_9BACL|nr:pyruvate kinase [Cohnella luojiensis]TFE26303.1 pyruvate kinase [Cohnella luojiensis]